MDIDEELIEKVLCKHTYIGKRRVLALICVMKTENGMNYKAFEDFVGRIL